MPTWNSNLEAGVQKFFPRMLSDFGRLVRITW
jgi:hypothetical protein